MGTLQSLRKAYGALKDSTTVSLVKVNSNFKELDIAIVKATNHSETPPKERYVRKIIMATSATRPRTDIAYCIRALSRRLARTHDWTVALKTLIVIHRILREGDTTFREELLNFLRQATILQVSNFKDDSSPLAWDCSAWVRSYALFLEERLECFRMLKYDIEAESSTSRATKVYSKTRELGCADLLEQLPSLQQLLYRLIGCQPEGGASHNDLVQYGLTLVLKESFKLYSAINDGIINLVDLFFAMSRYDAVKAFNIYKRAGQQAEDLAQFYEFCKGLDLSRNFQFPTLRQPPPSFLVAMEEYIKEAPRVAPISNKSLENEQSDVLATSEAQCSDVERVHNEENFRTPATDGAYQSTSTNATKDILDLDDFHPSAVDTYASNNLSLGIISQDGDSNSTSSHTFTGSWTDTSGWEIALVCSPRSNCSSFAEGRGVEALNNLLLDSLYEVEKIEQQQQNIGCKVEISGQQPDSKNPFSTSDVQFPLMTQQQQHQQHHMTNAILMIPHYPNEPLNQKMQIGGGINPFDEPFWSFSQSRSQRNPSFS